jgi:alkaline phosphatase
MKHFPCLAALILLLASISASAQPPATAPRTSIDPPARNIILLIGDGMGFGQVQAASYYAHGTPDSLCFQTLPHSGEITTAPANGDLTDSAAGATAMATGHKVANGVVSIADPGASDELPTVLELLQARGKAVGLITTTEFNHATPAAFAAHESSRGNLRQIVGDFLQQTRPNVIMGGDWATSADLAREAGYTVVTTRDELDEASQSPDVNMLCGLFGEGHMPYEYLEAQRADSAYNHLPHLARMTQAGLAILARDPDGFFLMVEGGRIDHAGHNQGVTNPDDRTRCIIQETLEFARAAQVALDFAREHGDTLVIITADHETGGLTVTEGRGQGEYPAVHWATGDHTAANVPIYAFGPGGERVRGVMDNTDVFRLMVGQPLANELAEPCLCGKPAAAVPATQDNFNSGAAPRGRR